MSRANALSVSRGFTLVEVLLVVVILGVIAAVSIPFFGKLRRRTELRSMAMEIGTTLVAARMKAVRDNGDTRVVITANSTDDGTHVFTTIEPTPAAPVPRSVNPMAQLHLNSRAFRFVTLPEGNAVVFDPAGRLVPPPPAPTPSVIEIEGPVGGGRTNRITIETSSGGRVRIVTPAVWQ